MTPQQEKILIALVNIHRQQTSGSAYFDPKNGGAYSNDIGSFIGLAGDEIEMEAQQLETDGYLVSLDRGNPKVSFKGLQAKQSALDWVDAKNTADKQAQSDAEASEALVANQAAQLEVDLIALRDDPALAGKLEIAMQKIIERLIILKKY